MVDFDDKGEVGRMGKYGQIQVLIVEIGEEKILMDGKVWMIRNKRESRMGRLWLGQDLTGGNPRNA